MPSKKNTITVQIPLRNPSNRKKQRIDSMMKRQGEIAEKVAELMPSISPSRWGGSRADSVFHRWVDKFFPNNNGLRSHDANQVSYKVCENFETYKSQGYPGDKPCYDSENQSWARFCNCNGSIKYECNEGKWGVRLPLEPRDHEWFRLKVGEYQEHYLTKEEASFGDAELKKEGSNYVLNQTVSFPKIEVDENPKVMIGVDLGLNEIAVAIGLDGDENYVGGAFSNSPFFSGDKVRHYREKMRSARKRLQEADQPIGKIKKWEEQYPKQVNDTVSKRIVDFADEFDSSVIKFENLKYIRERINNADPSKFHKRRLNSWSFFELQNYTQYKAEMRGIGVKKVNPKNTSRECPDCGHISENNREGIDFECQECGYENHADFVGAWNIAKRKR